VGDRQSTGGHFGNAVVPSSNSPVRGGGSRCSRHTSGTIKVWVNQEQAQSLLEQAAMMPAHTENLAPNPNGSFQSLTWLWLLDDLAANSHVVVSAQTVSSDSQLRSAVSCQT